LSTRLACFSTAAAQDGLPTVASLYLARSVDSNCREFSGAAMESAKQMACGSFTNGEGRRQWQEFLTTVQADGWRRHLRPGQVIGPPVYSRPLDGGECLEFLQLSYDWDRETYRVTTWGFVIVDAPNCSDEPPLMIVRPARAS
jgi:hypothetical protein